ncbi:MAG: VWA-like domain-containing protein [Lachnospiraceae bacterium]|nr:VWA-like domain-containing protein [Lachnospiraceae bacterium]
MRDEQDVYEEFTSARREAQKLEAALELLRPGAGFSDQVREEFVRYLIWRKRPAVQYLIRNGDLGRLRELKKMGWLEEQYLESYRELAITCRETEIWSWLVTAGIPEPKQDAAEHTSVQSEESGSMSEKADRNESVSSETVGKDSEVKTEEASAAENTDEAEKQLCRRVWKLTIKNLRMKLPGLSEALSGLDFRPELQIDTIACDGFTVFYRPEFLLDTFRCSAGDLERILLHLILHNMYLHPLLMRGRSERHWNLACDLTVERMLDSWNIRGLGRPGADYRSYLLKELKLPRHWTGTEAMYDILMKQYPNMEQLKKLEELYRLDDHCKWIVYRPKQEEDFRMQGQSGEEGRSSQGDGKAFLEKWEHLRKEWNPQMGEEHNRAGNQAGSKSQKAAVRKKSDYDYRSFLEEFMVCQEEVELDLDSMDYLPYWYSRNHYRDIVLIEPLEYKEVHKLDEMVIAIDTSGSCSGRIVRQFLQETWSILTESGNFFKKMHVHIIQCDSAIQEHVVVHSREEFQDYMDHVTIKGLGGTDFRPVFELVQKLIDEKELLNLKALLYFTDGDGVYPKDPPSFETAFIFLNQFYEKQKIPEWGIRLNLGLKLEE